MTSVKVVREMHEQCQELIKLFNNMRLKVSRKDVSMQPEVSLCPEYSSRLGLFELEQYILAFFDRDRAGVCHYTARRL